MTSSPDIHTAGLARGAQNESVEARLARARARVLTACVTGTNGKTTTTSMIDAIVAASGEPAARVTTLGSWVAGQQLSDATTLDALVRAADAVLAHGGVRTLAIETTSKALAEGFAARWPAHVAVFTNLTRDHLDYHGTPERYLAAKAQLFMALGDGGVAVLNAADPASALLEEVTPRHAERAGYAGRALAPECAALPLALRATRVRATRDGTVVELAPSDLARRLGGALVLGVVGEVHAENALAAAVAADGLGYASAAIGAGLAKFAGVPGRFEVVARVPLVVVDYAHTPDALARTLALARALARPEGGRVLCVFGCGGDRDAGKRPLMGRVAAEGADAVIVTSDNPRSEDPARIAADIEAGMGQHPARVERELDRARAIARAIALAAPRDVVVIAGKGHERFQIVGDQNIPFSDATVATRCLEGTPVVTVEHSERMAHG